MPSGLAAFLVFAFLNAFLSSCSEMGPVGLADQPPIGLSSVQPLSELELPVSAFVYI